MLIQTPKIKCTLLRAYDPGGTTGYAAFKISPAGKSCTIIDAGQFSTWRGLDKQIVPRSGLVVVHEEFHVLTMSAITIPLRVIGVIEYLCGLNKVPIFSQPPSERKSATLLRPDLVNYFPNHVKDAVMHGIVFMLKHRLITHPDVIQLGPAFKNGTETFRRIQSLHAQG